MMKKILLAVILLSLSFAMSVSAESIILKSGKTIEGEIVERTTNYIKIDFYGSTLTYYLDEIDSIDGEKIIQDVTTSVAEEKIIYFGKEDKKEPSENNLTEESKAIKTDPLQDKTRDLSDIKVIKDDSKQKKPSGLFGFFRSKEPGRYYNKRKGFSIKFPEGWKKQKTTKGTIVTFGSPIDTAMIAVQKQKICSQKTLADLIKYMESRIKRVGGEILDTGETVIDDTDAYWMLCELKGESILNYCMIREDGIYVIIATADEDDFLEDEIRKSVRSFRFE